jgi:hypothetical protein
LKVIELLGIFKIEKNQRYLESGDQEDCCSRPAQAKSLQASISINGWMCACHPREFVQGSTNRKILVQPAWAYSETLSQKQKVKKAGGLVHMAEHLPN